jgi:hypothetical protein
MTRTKDHPVKGSKTIRAAAVAVATKKAKPAAAAAVKPSKKQAAAAAAAKEEEEEDSAESSSESEEDEESSESEEEEEEAEPISHLLGTGAAAKARGGFTRYAPGSVGEKQAARRRHQAEKKRQKRIAAARRHAKRIARRLLDDKPQPKADVPKASAKEFVIRALFQANDGEREPIRSQTGAIDAAMYYANLVMQTYVLPDALKRRLVSIPIKSLADDRLLAVAHAREVDDAYKHYLTLTEAQFRGIDSSAVYEQIKAPLVKVYAERAAKQRDEAQRVKYFKDLAQLIDVTTRADDKGELGSSGRAQLLVMEKELAEYRLEKFASALGRAKAANTRAGEEKESIESTVLPALAKELEQLEEKGARHAAKATAKAKEAYDGAKAKYDEASGRLVDADASPDRAAWIKERDKAQREKRDAKAEWKKAEHKEAGVPRAIAELQKRITKKKAAAVATEHRHEKLQAKVEELKKNASTQRKIIKRANEAMAVDDDDE